MAKFRKRSIDVGYVIVVSKAELDRLKTRQTSFYPRWDNPFCPAKGAIWRECLNEGNFLVQQIGETEDDYKRNQWQVAYTMKVEG